MGTATDQQRPESDVDHYLADIDALLVVATRRLQRIIQPKARSTTHRRQTLGPFDAAHDLNDEVERRLCPSALSGHGHHRPRDV